MSQIQTQIINHLHNTTSDMATIIGRYKGCVGVCVEEVREIASLPNVSGYAKQRLENLASVLENIVAENERLWDKRGQREAKDADPNTISLDQAVELFNQTQIKVTNQRATDIVQLERA